MVAVAHAARPVEGANALPPWGDKPGLVAQQELLGSEPLLSPPIMNGEPAAAAGGEVGGHSGGLGDNISVVRTFTLLFWPSSSGPVNWPRPTAAQFCCRRSTMGCSRGGDDLEEHAERGRPVYLRGLEMLELMFWMPTLMRR